MNQLLYRSILSVCQGHAIAKVNHSSILHTHTYILAWHDNSIHCWFVLSEINQISLVTCSLSRQSRSHIFQKANRPTCLIRASNNEKLELILFALLCFSIFYLFPLFYIISSFLHLFLVIEKEHLISTLQLQHGTGSVCICTCCCSDWPVVLQY